MTGPVLVRHLFKLLPGSRSCPEIGVSTLIYIHMNVVHSNVGQGFGRLKLMLLTHNYGFLGTMHWEIEGTGSVG